MGGGSHVKHPPIPHWQSFKIEDAPKLIKIQERLAAHGLKDPWLRNEVWRFHKCNGTTAQRIFRYYTRGFKYGLILALAHVGVKSFFFSNDDHEHH